MWIGYLLTVVGILFAAQDALYTYGQMEPRAVRVAECKANGFGRKEHLVLDGWLDGGKALGFQRVVEDVKSKRVQSREDLCLIALYEDEGGPARGFPNVWVLTRLFQGSQSSAEVTTSSGRAKVVGLAGSPDRKLRSFLAEKGISLDPGTVVLDSLLAPARPLLSLGILAVYVMTLAGLRLAWRHALSSAVSPGLDQERNFKVFSNPCPNSECRNAIIPGIVLFCIGTYVRFTMHVEPVMDRIELHGDGWLVLLLHAAVGWTVVYFAYEHGKAAAYRRLNASE